ncbi:hypothetical protein IV203_007820 [Nitzschia inconspicua]|uniref:Uncharacterized protein n=1 Tax=Nitzschia inconspicua TaxID=303405 RepID=A0A9K3KYF6_9STRA|nr:hypothetical protein IV203_007820 [Nitzschia inconspicua]
MTSSASSLPSLPHLSLEVFPEFITIDESSTQQLINRTTLNIPVSLCNNRSSPVQNLLKLYVYDTHPSCLTVDLELFVEEVGYSYNWITDLVLIRLFQTFPGRTYDPQQADIFVVPYLHMAHCMKAGYWIQCKSLPERGTSKDVLGQLPYYNVFYSTSTCVLLVRIRVYFSSLVDASTLVGHVWSSMESQRQANYPNESSF